MRHEQFGPASTVRFEFNPAPISSAYLYSAYSLGVLKESRLLTVSHIQLYYRGNQPDEVRRANSLRYEFYPRMSVLQFGAAGDLDVRTEELTDDDPSAIIARFLRALDGKACIYTFVDLFYIPKSITWRLVHLRHELLISGYDGERQAFQVADYDRHREFSVRWVPAGLVAEAYRSRAVDSVCAEYCRYRVIHVMRVAPLRAYNLADFENIYHQIDDLLNSRLSFVEKIADAQQRPLFACGSEDFKNGVWGIATYDHVLSELREFALRKRRSVDLRMTRTLWEHKKIMAARLKKLEELGLTAIRDVATQWPGVVQCCHAIHLSVFDAVRSGAALDIARLEERFEQFSATEKRLLKIVQQQLRAYIGRRTGRILGSNGGVRGQPAEINRGVD